MSHAPDIYSDTLFVGMTRPAMKLGIPVQALILEIMPVVIVVIATHNPLYLLALLPIHGILRLISANNPWIFSELWIWLNTFVPCINTRFWGAASFSPLPTKKWTK